MCLPSGFLKVIAVRVPEPYPDGAQPDRGRGLREVLVSEIVEGSLCSRLISDTGLPSESQLWPTLTQWLCPVHGLNVHEAWQIGPHQDDVAAGPLVGTVDAPGLPVSPVDIGVKEGEAIGVLDGGHQRVPAATVQVGSLNSLWRKETVEGGYV